MRRVEYLISECMDCPFYDTEGYEDECVCRETSVGCKLFNYPDENDWFPKWCPLEK